MNKIHADFNEWLFGCLEWYWKRFVSPIIDQIQKLLCVCSLSPNKVKEREKLSFYSFNFFSKWWYKWYTFIFVEYIYLKGIVNEDKIL